MNYNKPVGKLLFTLLGCLALSFAVQCQTTFTQWTYDTVQGTNAAPTPNSGTGTSTTVGSMTGATTATGSVDGCSQATGLAWQIGTAAPGSTNESSGVEFKTSTVGYENVKFIYDHRFSGSTTRTVRVQYTTDGSTWINYDLNNSNYTNSCASRGGLDLGRIDVTDPIGNNASDSWSRRSIDFTSISAANNNPNFGVRILAAHHTTTGQFRQANNVTAVATGGTWRLDNVSFAGTTIPVNNPTVSLSVNANSGSETNATLITVTATTSENVTGNQTVDLAITGTNITVGDYTLSNTTITIPDGSNTGFVTFTIVDDAIVEGDETATLTLQNLSSGIALGSPASQNITITDNDTPPLPKVNLSVNSTQAIEADATKITLTATSDIPVTGNQTVTVLVSGTDITSSDYYLTSVAITIPSGQTTGSIKFIVADDAKDESEEVATVTLTSPTSGVMLGDSISKNITIINNNCSMLTKANYYTSSNGAEISAFDPASDRLFTVAGNTVEYFSVSNTGQLALIGTLNPGFDAPENHAAIPNSVAVKNGKLVASYAIRNNTTNAQDSGRVSFFNCADVSFIKSFKTGYLPDMVTFSPDGNKVLTANEGEPNSYNQGNSFDPEGSVSIIDINNGILNGTVTHAGFTAFNGDIAALRAEGVRIFGPNATVAQDFEPEYIAFKNDSIVVASLQENNAFAFININTSTVIDIVPLGLKNHNLAGNGMDASDRDSTSSLGKINIQNWPVFGMYLPDAIASYSVNGQTYFLSANEGDSRDYTGFAEEIRVGAGGYVLDPTVFPNAATLKQNANLGRLQLTNATCDNDNDGDKDQICALGARSFTVWDQNGSLVYDSGDDIEQTVAERTPTLFNSEGLASNFDTRSDNKGPEPEGVVVGNIDGVPYAFVGLERTGDIMVFNVQNPNLPQFVQYINSPEDLAVEGLTFVSSADSPTGFPLLITTAEVSLTVSVYEIGKNMFTYFADADNDGYGNPASTAIVNCSPNAPEGYVSNNDDCNDESNLINPEANEICDGIDNNCNDTIDEGVLNTYYADADNDGFGNADSTTFACELPLGFVTNNDDCNDDNNLINPEANEVCDETDNNCDTVIDEYCGCTNELAHNYDEEAEIDNGSCETCNDGIKNGDEVAVDCGGILCASCTPPTAVCGNIIDVNVNPSDIIYNGPGASDVYLVPALDLDGGTVSYSPQTLTRQVKRTYTNIAFNWTTNGACIDATPNGVYNNNDKGLVYRDCLPVAPADFNKIRNFDMTVSDQFGTSTCSGRYRVIYSSGSTNPELSIFDQALTESDNSISLFEMYPNPGNNNLNIELNFKTNLESNFSLMVIDVLGKQILSMDKINERIFTLDTSTLPSGTYTVIVKSDLELLSQRWIKY